jgi:two-component system, chemotaxis family, sensor kinase CheA
MDQMASIRQTFFQECEEQLQALEEGLVEMDSGDHSAEVVNSVFRAVHSIKGGAGAFKLSELVEFAHAFETVLDEIRSEKLSATHDIAKLLLKSSDQLSDLVATCRDERKVDPANYRQLLEELQQATSGGAGEEDDSWDDLDFTPMTIDIPAGEVADALNTFEIYFKPSSGAVQSGNEPILILRSLMELGETRVTCDCSSLPSLDEMQVEEAYLGFNITLRTEKSLISVRECFEFVEDSCLVRIEEPGPDSGETSAAPASLVEETPMQLPPIPRFTQAAVAAKSGDSAGTGSAPSDAEAEPVVLTAIEGGKSEASATKQEKTLPSASATIRVELDRVDRLINLVGELVINQAILAQSVGQAISSGANDVNSGLEELERLTRDIQDSVMAIRAQPVKSLFQRMGRIVREVADATGKTVRLRTEGETTEVDKTVIESLADPLTHMIRNAVDHGLETTEDRIRAGKSEEGTVRLSAAHQSGRVVITVADDGGGINRPKVLETARRKGLVLPGAQLTESEIDNLLFLPGFSTATEVSSISGRGVGMDVVRRSIQALGGRISISSKPAVGTVFTMSLPLTLAVLDGVVVSVAEDVFIVPLTSVVETLQAEAKNILPLGQGHSALRIREWIVPLVDVGMALGVRKTPIDPENAVAILVDTEERSRCALLVDRIDDQRQVVIKSIESNYGEIPGIAAATILGNGRVAMILDVETITERNQRNFEAPKRMSSGGR